MISLFISSPYFPATSFCSKNQKRSRLSQESSNEKSLELSYLTSDTCPLMCDNRFQTSLSSGPTPKDHLPLPHIIPHHFFFFFYTKIHESLATGVTVRWIKIFIAPFALPEIPSVQLNISERRARSPKVTDNGANAKWNWWAKFSTLCLRNVPCNPLHCVLFFYSAPNPPPLTPKPHMSLSREEANSWKRLLRLFPGFMCSSGIYWHNLIMGPSQNGINGR